jgi:hypothetical protein
MRRLTLVLALSLVSLMLAEQAAAAAPFTAQFTQHFGRGEGASTGPCAIAFCGMGQVVGYGQAELTLVATGAVPTTAAGCSFALAVTGSATIELLDGSTLLMDETGTYCLPGDSTTAPGNFFHSYGNPWQIDATYVVIGGSGVFAGATGTGVNTIRQGGDAQISVYAGTLSVT